MNGSRGERVLVVLDSAKPAYMHNDDVPNAGAALLTR